MGQDPGDTLRQRTPQPYRAQAPVRAMPDDHSRQSTTARTTFTIDGTGYPVPVSATARVSEARSALCRVGEEARDLDWRFLGLGVPHIMAFARRSVLGLLSRFARCPAGGSTVSAASAATQTLQPFSSPRSPDAWASAAVEKFSFAARMSTSTVEDLQDRINKINDKFAEARDEIELAEDVSVLFRGAQLPGKLFVSHQFMDGHSRGK